MINRYFLIFLILFVKFGIRYSFDCKPGFSGKNCNKCGISYKEQNVRIVGGREAEPNSWPSIALIVFSYKFDFEIADKIVIPTTRATCGGTLIDRNSILTAAHCFLTDVSFNLDGQKFEQKVVPNKYFPTYESMYTVYLGLHNMSGIFDKISSIYPGKAYKVEEFILHPKYDAFRVENDIAFIKLKNDVVLDKNVQIACLPDKNLAINDDTPGWVAGWGLINAKGISSLTLQNAKITIYVKTQCYDSSPKNWKIQICAGEKSGGIDTCQGDSGGPLIIKKIINGIERSVLVGITSYGYSCGKPRYPGIYTRISAFLNWIIETSKKVNPLINHSSIPSFNCSKTNQCNTCGLRFVRPNIRILGGVEAAPYSWPSMALIRFNYTFEYNNSIGESVRTVIYKCAGSLINNVSVLTAANCFITRVKFFDEVFKYVQVRPNKFFPTIRSMYTVYLGVHDMNDIQDSGIKSPIQKFGIHSFKKHPRFNSSNNFNDIGIIRLDRPVQFNQYIQPACLPKFSGFPRKTNNRSTWIAGWGYTSPSSGYSNTLRNVKMFLYDGKFCQNVYPNVVKNWNKQLCAGAYEGGKDTCVGDAGAPLFLKMKTNGLNRFVVSGITSYGEGCGRPGFPALYTKVSSYLTWINANSKSRIKTSRYFLKRSKIESGRKKRKSNKAVKNCRYGKVGKYCDVCGNQFYNPNLKIVGGIEAKAHSWPSTVLLRFKYNYIYIYKNETKQGFKSGFCGGNLIDRRTILTAAHCFIKKFPIHLDKTYKVNVVTNSFHPTFESMYTVYLGLHGNKGVFDGTSSIHPGIEMSIDKFIVHENYTEGIFVNDIAIIKLSKEVKLDYNIQPACLPNPKFKSYPKKYDIPVWAAGWGTLALNGSIPWILHNVKMTLYNYTQCDNVIDSKNKAWEKLICAGEMKGGKDTCLGDSGGPLFVKDWVNGIKKYVLVGLTSSGDGCGNPNSPGVYTKISEYLKWIDIHREK